ncbi:MAG: DNA mismatch endonuclease Vsr [Phycisphaeraceae bacterium]|nr:MAG: DNA mismatch endonuclease Vsr [Phycisphaeraceae bacterium]
MPDVLSPEQRSRNMRAIKASNTAPELTVRRVLHALGYRFRLHRRDLPGCPDIVLPRRRVAVFVHGCFWHRHQCRYGRVEPTTRPEFWRAKFATNVQRDKRSIRALRRMGWRVLVVWECQTGDIDRLEKRLQKFLNTMGASN